MPAPRISISVQLIFQEPRLEGTAVWDNHSCLEQVFPGAPGLAREFVQPFHATPKQTAIMAIMARTPKLSERECRGQGLSV